MSLTSGSSKICTGKIRVSTSGKTSHCVSGLHVAGSVQTNKVAKGLNIRPALSEEWIWPSAPAQADRARASFCFQAVCHVPEP